ncbi:MAG TPA: YbjN domain-containing protein [Acetobacteraceae bacterium]|jgi:hypothetical protein|nr:YbjN domain-containing protein [Acetobacteraceae bacterium]
MRWIVGLLMLCLATASACATPLPDGGVTAQEVADVLQHAGYKAEITQDKYGDPLIKSASSGVNFSVYFYTCKNSPRCTSIQFYAGFQKPGIALERVAEWNRTTRFGKVYLDQDGDPRIEMDMDVEHGANTEALQNDLDRWVAVLAAFVKYIGW